MTPSSKNNSGIRPQYVPILPRHDLYLFHVGGDAQKFVAAFRRTWCQMPVWARRTLLKHWRRTRPALLTSPACHWPSIELVPLKSDFECGNSGDALAQTKANGSEFAFLSGGTDQLPESAVEAVIAHELAHAIHFIKDRDGHLAGRQADVFGFSQAEFDADETAESWGFDMEFKRGE